MYIFYWYKNSRRVGNIIINIFELLFNQNNIAEIFNNNNGD